MTDTGDKMVDGMRDALKAAKCQHDWAEILTTTSGIWTRRVEACHKCGSRQTVWLLNPDTTT